MLLRQQTCLIFQKKKSRMARVKLTLQANNYTIYIKRQGTQLNRIANKKKTSNLFKNSNVIKQFFFIFLYIKLIFLRFCLIFRDIFLSKKKIIMHTYVVLHTY